MNRPKLFLLGLLGCIATLAVAGVSCHQLTRSSSVAGECPQPCSLPLITGYIAIGYDLLAGNPEGEFVQGGIDPGLRFARRILKHTYNNSNLGYHNNGLVLIPDQVSYQATHSCSSVQTVHAFSGTASYQRKLDTKFNGQVGRRYGLSSFRFGLSTGYSSARTSTKESRKVMIDKEVICNDGSAHYNLDTALNNHYSIADDFYYAVKNLPATYNEDEYKRFIQLWGTHVIVGATFGGRQVKRYSMSYTKMYLYASTHVSGSVSASGSYAGYSRSFTVNTDSFSEQVSSSASFSSNELTINSGSTIVSTSDGLYKIADNNSKAPIPILMSLKPITIALDPRLWTELPESNKSYTTLGIAAKLTNLEQALRDYPSLSRASRGENTSVIFPNAWPDGTYCLPKPRSGCPSGAHQFRWHEGTRYHDTEDTDSNNQFSNPLSLDGQFNRNNIQIHYCTKTDTSIDYGLPWPAGSYCIAKKGNCPSGFGEGHIYWDDEDSSNANSHSGIIPDGTYDGNTKTYFCCRDDGFTANPIVLPIDTSFYLYRKHATDGCQQVRGMSVRDEFVRWDNEDSNNADYSLGNIPFEDGGSDNHKLHYCYYYK